MRDYTDEREDRQERTNIVFYADDLDCIAKIQQFVGVRGKAAAVRYALRQTAAAAPDLLEACKFAAEQMNHYGNTANWPTDMPMEYGEAINRLRSAIAKAKEA